MISGLWQNRALIEPERQTEVAAEVTWDRPSVAGSFSLQSARFCFLARIVFSCGSMAAASTERV
jgi:hypothetical protein